jgi:DHA2 family multidrug resistance protein
LVSRELLARVAEMLSAGGVPDAVRDVSALHYLGRVVEAQATTLGFQDGFMLITAVFLAALVPAAILGRSVKRRR